jgi:four helix bundle protein
MLPFERFKAWRLCHQLVIQVYRVTGGFPTTERYGLVSQMRRAAFSAAANIAEGSAKRGEREFRRYLDISLGSLSELAYALKLARDISVLSETDYRSLDRLRNHAGTLTWKLHQSLKNARRSTEPSPLK